MKSPPTAAMPRCLVLRMGAVLLAPAEDALDHGPARLGDAVADVPGRALVDGAGAPRIARTPQPKLRSGIINPEKPEGSSANC